MSWLIQSVSFYTHFNYLLYYKTALKVMSTRSVKNPNKFMQGSRSQISQTGLNQEKLFLEDSINITNCAIIVQ